MAQPMTGARGLDARNDGRRTGWTPAQWYCVLAGAALLLAGITGFIADSSFDVGSNVDGGSLIGFEVNGIHNLVHIASGLLLLAAFRSRHAAKTVTIAFAAVYGIVTIIGIVDGHDVLGLFPVNAADNVLHVALTLVGALAAIASPTDEHAGRSKSATTLRERSEQGNERFGRDVDPLSGHTRDDETITRT